MRANPVNTNRHSLPAAVSYFCSVISEQEKEAGENESRV